MREERIPTSLRGAESVLERGTRRYLVCGVGDATSRSRKLRKKIATSDAATFSHVVARGGASDGSRRCRSGWRITAPLRLARREFRLGSKTFAVTDRTNQAIPRLGPHCAQNLQAAILLTCQHT